MFLVLPLGSAPKLARFRPLAAILLGLVAPVSYFTNLANTPPAANSSSATAGNTPLLRYNPLNYTGAHSLYPPFYRFYTGQCHDAIIQP